jgi:UDP-N-acetylmuramoyl-tripeptide--D-alanyl-D-alanine ligase
VWRVYVVFETNINGNKMNTIAFTYKDLQTATSGRWYNLDFLIRNSESSTLHEQGNQEDKIEKCKTGDIEQKVNSWLNEEKQVDAGLMPTYANRISFISTDTRLNNKNALFLALSGINFDAHNFLQKAIDSGATALCLQKGKYELNKIPSNIPVLEVHNTLKAYQDIANFHRKRLKGLTLIALTGSNGKTSTKDILHGILSAEFGKEKVYTTKANTNNFIGVPQNILNLTDKHKVAVIELGSNHPGEIGRLTKIVNPDIAVITSIGPAHLEYFKDINGVIEEKTSIFTAFNNHKKGIAIIPTEYSNNNIFLQKTDKSRTVTFGKTENGDIYWKHLNTNIDKCKFKLHWRLNDLSQKVLWNIPGIHQLSNAAAAAAVATVIEITPSNIATALRDCKISGMRMRINKVNDITWINDAYNANPSSTRAGVDWLHEMTKDVLLADKHKRLYVVLGDMLELGKNTLDVHREIIEYTVNKLPSFQIIGVGPIMSEVIKHLKFIFQNSSNLHSFLNSDEAAFFFKSELQTNDLIYLKGSRGIALEKIEQKYEY